jgi:hypothetical protein
MANDEQLSQQDIEDLQVIASHLPTGHPMQKKLSVLLNSQPTQFEKDRPQIPEDYGFTPENMIESGVKGIGNAVGGLAAGAIGPGTPIGVLRDAYREATGQAALEQEQLDNAKRLATKASQATSPVEKAGRYAAAALTPVGGQFMTQMGERAGRGDVGGALAETAGTFGAGELAKGARGAQNAVRSAIYTPEGVLKPGIETASKVAGGAVGAGAGAVAGHGGGAIAGAYGGAKLGPSVTRALFPRPPAAPLAPVYPGGSLPLAVDFYAARGAEINEIRRQQPDAFAPPAPELGSPENPGFMSKLPTRLPPNLRGDPFSPTPPQYRSSVGDIPSEEGVTGSVPKPSGRLVVLPQEAAALDQLQRIAKTRASQHGMLYAAGMRPAGGGRVPTTSTEITTTEYPGPRPDIGPDAYAPPEALQGNPSPFDPPEAELAIPGARRPKAAGMPLGTRSPYSPAFRTPQ